jgi:hypothetical protein
MTEETMICGSIAPPGLDLLVDSSGAARGGSISGLVGELKTQAV